MAIIGIVAVARNHAIGKDGKLPWHYPADLKFFKETTTGHAVVMGSRTWKAIGKELPNRLNIVLSRSARPEDGANVIFLQHKGQVVTLSNYLREDTYLIGGAKTYAELADVVDRWIVTRIPLTVDGADSFMPAGFLDGFTLSNTIELDGDLVVETFRR